MTATFDDLIIGHGMPWRVAELLPAIRTAGESAGTLTEDGARRLDPTGILQPGISLCPSEGDAGTGMVATNSVAPRTGNVSAGTSIFAMVVLEHPLSRVHHELDVVTTPAGDPVAMVHCNNGAGELNAWVSLFAEFAAAIDADIDTSTVFRTLLRASLSGAPDCGGLLAYNYLSGEPITGLHEGRPMFVRSPDSAFNLANFMRTHLFAALATLRVGMDVLKKDEGVRLDTMYAPAASSPPKTSPRSISPPQSTPRCRSTTPPPKVAPGASPYWPPSFKPLLQTAPGRIPQDGGLAHADLTPVQPDAADIDGFNTFMQRYTAALPVQRAASGYLRYTPRDAQAAK